MTKKYKSISPLTSKPLRNPGESLDHKIIDMLDKSVIHVLIIAVIVTTITQAWVAWYHQEIADPLILSIVLSPVILFSLVRIFFAVRESKRIKLGRDGEKVVGQFLERLRLDGAQVFHDIEGENFNLDHVVIHRSGIFVIETKTMSKPEKGKSVLFYNGKQILRGGKPIKSDAVTQVKAASSWLHNLLFESTGKRFAIKGIVVFPGWYVKTTELGKSAEISVLNPRVLPNYIGKSRQQLREDELHMCAYHLSRYIRTK
ncbi:NERD domain-containing protein [Pseudidiomarina gelatinasegens]|uniref:NERD domain-containing protein n=2 Tax=Pseudidiomarina gelatinasegens TaxID=2487740 RepID=A0A443YYF8_9GAMM|nr:nuclease-related domain-containing protein [Pseudidiomarina gelatinasegens]RWU09127.1 NERD domain-containing protein [Pseudidiomarina gelatinasegens]